MDATNSSEPVRLAPEVGPTNVVMARPAVAHSRFLRSIFIWLYPCPGVGRNLKSVR